MPKEMSPKVGRFIPSPMVSIRSARWPVTVSMVCDICKDGRVEYIAQRVYSDIRSVNTYLCSSSLCIDMACLQLVGD